MPIWKLTPIDETSSCWKYSTYCGYLLVRAVSDAAAREIAATAYTVAAPIRSFEPINCGIPWLDHQQVTCTEVLVDSEYNENGADGVVGPQAALQTHS